ncbi:hypothetical protein Ancab_027317 [Ancistrocladus abbreviatus]
MQMMKQQQQLVMPIMESVFQLAAADRANFLLRLMHSFGGTYICLCCLFFEDGYYSEEINQASSSTGFLAYDLLKEYQHQPIFIVENDFVPGLAFKRRSPYIELNEFDLQRLASVESQRQFYLTAVFMGCKRGEIELGMSLLQQINLETEMMNLFPVDFSQQSPIMELPGTSAQDQTRPSSSSSPSIDSSEYTSLLFSLSSSSYLEEPIFNESPLMIEESTFPISTTVSNLPTPQLQQEEATPFQAFGQLQHTVHAIPTSESTTDAAMTKGNLAILPSDPDPDPFSISLQQTQASAFRRYRKGLAPLGRLEARDRRQSVIKSSIAYLKSLGYQRLQQRVHGNCPTSAQLHHIISERRRRKKINESVQALRTFLPARTKKDQASVLKSTKEYLSTLESRISELSQRNQHLEEQLLFLKKNNNDRDHHQDGTVESSPSSPSVRLMPIAESTSEQRLVDLQVTSMGGALMLTDLTIQILEFLKQFKEIKLESLEAQSHRQGPNRLIMRLRIDQNGINTCGDVRRECAM